MQSNYQVTETNNNPPITSDLSEDPPFYYFTDNNNYTHPFFALPNPQMFQNHHQYSWNNYPNLIPHQFRMIYNNNSQPHFDHQFSQPTWQLRGVREPPQQSDELILVHPRPVNCFKLGLMSNESTNNNNNIERVFAHQYHHGQKFMMPQFCRQTHDDDNEEYSYPTAATKEQFYWNNYDAISNANEKKDDNVDVTMRENNNISLCNNSNDKEVVVDERRQFMRFYGTELEAIYGLSKNNLGETSYNQTGSSSALTAENSPVGANLATNPTPFCDDIDNDQATRRNDDEIQKKKKKRKRKRKEMFKSMTSFFEGLVENVMSHQDRLHGKFMEVIERIDRKRSEREEVWKFQEAQAQSREAIARVKEQAMASTREALILSHLEKITGQRVDVLGDINQICSISIRSPQEFNDPCNSTSTINLCSENLVDIGFGVQRQSYVELLKGFTSQPCSTSFGKLFEVSEMAGKMKFDKEEFEDDLVEEEDQEDNVDTNNED